MTTFTFNRNYDDKEQIREWLPEFAHLRESMAARGEYPYNDSFVGRIPGLAGPNEATGIYLLQCLYRIEEEHRAIIRLRAELRELDILESTTRYAKVVVYRAERFVGGTGSIDTLANARVEPGPDGTPYAVIPARKRKGYRVDGALVLVGEAVR
jgi:hypothetical protein